MAESSLEPSKLSQIQSRFLLQCVPVVFCSRFPEDVPRWGQTDAKARPIGSGCYLCMCTIAEGYPLMTFEQASETYHDSKNIVFRAGFAAARDLKAKMIQGEEYEKFNPPSSVMQSKTRSVRVSVEMLFLTEADILRILEVSGRNLGLGKPVSLPCEDGVVRNGYVVNPRGIMDSELKGYRKVFVDYTVSTEYAEHLLEAGKQIRKEQGQELWSVACNAVEESGPAVLKSTARHTLWTMAALRDKAYDIREDHP